MAKQKLFTFRVVSNSCTHIRHYSAPVDSSIPSTKAKYVPTSGTYPKGFRVSATHVGVKPANTKNPDLAFITSDLPANGAAVFTKNKFQAAPVQISRQILKTREGSGIRSIIINSGCANAVTGQGGLEDAKAMSDTASSMFKSDSSNSLVMSTGVIGQRLPISKILSKVQTAHSNLDDSHAAWLATAKAICTTDTFPKLLSTTFTLPGQAHRDVTYSLAGMTKGAGMIHPHMGTLLGVLATDAPISSEALKPMLRHAVNASFNCISIDGDTSTNDTVAILANGAASLSSTSSFNRAAAEIKLDTEAYEAMSAVLTSFATQLSHLVVRDGEGATKFVEVRVRNAKSNPGARKIASTIARSPLVKTALYGKDANWGRILCAVGYTGGLRQDEIDPSTASVSFVPVENSATKDEGELKLLVQGEPQAVDEARAARLLEDEDLIIDVNLGTGSEEAKYWFCDFSHEYVTINGDYRT